MVFPNIVLKNVKKICARQQRRVTVHCLGSCGAVAAALEQAEGQRGRAAWRRIIPRARGEPAGGKRERADRGGHGECALRRPAA